MTCLGVLNADDRDKDNATSLKGKGSIEMSTTFHVYDDALRFDFWYSITLTMPRLFVFWWHNDHFVINSAICFYHEMRCVATHGAVTYFLPLVINEWRFHSFTFLRTMYYSSLVVLWYIGRYPIGSISGDSLCSREIE